MVEMAFECGYCKTHIIKTQSQIIQDFEAIRWDRCSTPHCQKLNIFIENNRIFPVFPTLELNPNLPEEYAGRYKKAHHILNICPEASAASSRKCLELVLVDALGAKKRDLFDKLNEVESKISSDLSEQLHYLREIGNFGAHPRKNTHTTELLPVEPGEAEYCLELLLELFDECFVKPKKRENIKKMLDEKMKLAGKAPIKFAEKFQRS